MGFKEWFMLDPVAAIFYIVAVPATVILVLQTILLLFGLGHGDADLDSDTGGLDGHFDLGGHSDGHFDLGGHSDAHLDIGGHSDLDLNGNGIPDSLEADIDHDAGGMHGDSGLRLFTVRGLVAFFAVGGWSGIAAMELGASRFVAVIAAMLMGSAALILVALFLRWALSLQYNGTLNMHNAVGKTGEVYITVPAKNGGHGKVNVVVQERLAELEAVTECDRALRYGERVRVVGLADGNTLVVEPEQVSEKQ